MVMPIHLICAIPWFLDANSDSAAEVSFLDAYFSYDFGCSMLDLKPGTLGLRAGKWKSPFSRSAKNPLVDFNLPSVLLPIYFLIWAGLPVFRFLAKVKCIPCQRNLSLADQWNQQRS
jgi:hypothetical protein